MKIVLQRVKEAAVAVAGEEISRIGKGILILVGIEKGDSLSQVQELARKIAGLRIFEDSEGKMNLSVQTVGGEILVVSQFTLAADLKKGTRPSFDPAETPEKAHSLMESFISALKQVGLRVQEGRFAAKMEVMLVNDGPATFLLP